jgi:hypothetical protein
MNGQTTLVLRLFKNNANYRYQGIIYEQALDSVLEHNASFIKTASDIVIVHYGLRQLEREKYNLEMENALLKKVKELERRRR